jgi:peptidoglycan/LPS O-acetylase OafA/YrhL
MPYFFMQKSPKQTKARIKGFDGIRGIAALAVLIHHTVMTSTHLGDVAVFVFFALSGFLIIGILAEARSAVECNSSTISIELSRFWIDRGIRIFPVYYLCLSTLLVYALLFHSDTFQDLTTGSIWYFSYLQNFYIAFSTREWGSFTQVWSLAVEQQFYILFGITLLLVRRERFKILCTILFLVSACVVLILKRFGVSGITLYVLPFEGFCFILAGGIAQFLKTKVVSKNGVYSALSWLAVVVICVLAILPRSPDSQDSWSPFLPISATFVIFVLIVLSAFFLWSVYVFQASALVYILDFMPLQVAGQISYALYVIHYPVARAIFARTANKDIGFLATFVLSIALSVLSFYAMERPLGYWKRSLSINRRQAMRDGAPPINESHARKNILRQAAGSDAVTNVPRRDRDMAL